MKPPEINNDLLAPCGVYCGACSAYLRGTCLGCRSESRKQKRISKWSCRIRYCALHQKQIQHCGHCNELICRSYEKKLLKGHEKDIRYRYRFEAVENLRFLQQYSMDMFLEKMKEQYTCSACGGTVTFFEDRCFDCHQKVFLDS